MGSLLLLSAFAGVVAADDSLIVSVGLDQEVVLGDTVYLDGGGTHAVDGEVWSYDWAIETPESGTVTPDCTGCEQMSFQPSTTGQYDVTLTASTASGLERADTLYVTVSTYSADERDPTTSSSSSSGGGGCYVSNEANGGMTDRVCGHVGTVLEHDLGGGGDHIDAYIMEGEGFSSEYAGANYLGGDRYLVPEDSLKTQTDDLFEEATDDENGDSGNFEAGGGSEDSTSPNSCWGSSCALL